jgi:hypothetical protein
MLEWWQWVVGIAEAVASGWALDWLLMRRKMKADNDNAKVVTGPLTSPPPLTSSSPLPTSHVGQLYRDMGVPSSVMKSERRCTWCHRIVSVPGVCAACRTLPQGEIKPGDRPGTHVYAWGGDLVATLPEKRHFRYEEVR